MYRNEDNSNVMMQIIPEEFNNIKQDIDNNIVKLNYASKCGVVVKGFRETLKAIKTFKAKVVYLAVDCDQKDYIQLVHEFCEIFKIKLIKVKNWLDIRDNAMDCIPSHILIDKAKRLGKRIKITPKCYCAAILEYGNIEKKILDN
jgi:ribosomal protein L30E